MNSLSLIQKIAVWIVPLLLAITLHEAAHAWVAYKRGDTTAKMLGRLTFNPIAHIDPWGTLLLPLLVGVVSGFQFVFGWAKPVPINEQQLKNTKWDMALVTVAGPGANLLMALGWAAVLKITFLFGTRSSPAVLFMVLTAQAGILINLVLGFLNLLPILPLDGGRVVNSFLSARLSDKYMRLEPYGIFILLGLLLTGVLGKILSPLIFWSLNLIASIFNL